MAHLVVRSGGESGLLIPLEKEKTVLGRDPGCDVVIKETMLRRNPNAGRTSSVSRQHAIIWFTAGGYAIEDGDGRGNKSRNRTFVNDQPVPYPNRVPLHDNDRLRICDFICTFHREPDSTFAVEASIGRHSTVTSLQAQPAETLRVILEISNSLSHTLDADSLLPRIVDSLFQLFPQADRGFIILRDEASGRLVVRVSRTRRTGDDPEARFSDSIVRQCLEKVQAVLGNDLAEEFPDNKSLDGLPIRSLMCAPLWAQDGQALGAIQLDLEGLKKFTTDDLNLLLGVASQASIALSNARLHRDSLTHQRRLRDLEVAQQVQRALMPQNHPELSDYEFYAYYESAQEVGGDYYDFVPLPGGRLAVLLGDVAGKGVAAALVMVKFSVEARFCLQTEPDPAVAVGKLNALMTRASASERFVTLAAAVLDPATHTVTLVNAGHPSPLLARCDSGAVEEATPLETAGPPVGIVDGREYGSRQVELRPGDRLFLFSDGVSEAMNASGVVFGVKGIYAILQGDDDSPREAGERLIRAVKQHAAACAQHDDVTLVCFGRVDGRKPK